MMYPEEQINELKEEIGPGVRVFDESGYSYIYIPGLKTPSGCTPERTDALLCPQPHSGYPSRLFFKDRIQTSKTLNWNGQAYVLGHQWHAFSYNHVQNMSLLAMVMNHLRGLVA